MDGIRGPDWNKIKEDYIRLNGEVNLKEFAEKHGVKYSTLRSRKNREKWDNELKKVATKNATIKKDVASTGNKNKLKEKLVDNEVKRVMENTELTDKQKLFCVYYAKSFNATKAYQKAYRCSYNVANSEGYKLLVKPCIKEEIYRLKQNKLNRAMLDENDIVQKYIDIAFADVTDYIEFGKKEKIIGISDKGDLVKIEGNFIDLKNDYEVDGTLITEIKSSRQGISVKLEDRMKALEWLTRFFEMNPEHQYKKEFDSKKLQLERERFKHQKELDERSIW